MKKSELRVRTEDEYSDLVIRLVEQINLYKAIELQAEMDGLGARPVMFEIWNMLETLEITLSNVLEAMLEK